MENIKSLITEQQNQRSSQIDRKTTTEILETINEEDHLVPIKIKEEIPQIALVVNEIVKSINSGGRLIYVGAGTSGRIGKLDASECPPTYGTPPHLVQGIIAGGDQAVFQAVEGAEDSEELGALDMDQKDISEQDIVIGITASGRAPYVIGALKEARKRGAKTVSFTCNAKAKLHEYGDLHISIEVGPEVISGSTRMKAGTAQKLVLNMLTTAAMIKLGKVYDNLMVDVQPLNKKLIDRAQHIIAIATGCSKEEAQRLFKESGERPKLAIVMHHCQIDVQTAESLLQKESGSVHKAIRAYDNNMTMYKGGS
ncbi:N-acetylmuramic acid 6-phosphate etherase [Bacillus horti]|uniref:N-acetylmuramic acid 6-phosphate etherase n=1 Tax=Caldalkalibacillus horti TaxID=77523 RepID=A0ABT9VTJ8_9BACI|nr:N-acetylmuramic acid 6-phosphate etherase [Bacillus horti]MDQ0164318.1 N-acetylmuramic acid 6-phosphate etherase [Bacillus horti]